MEKIIFRDVDLMAFDTPWALVFILIFIVLMTAINSKKKDILSLKQIKKVDDAISINTNRKVRIKKHVYLNWDPIAYSGHLGFLK